MANRIDILCTRPLNEGLVEQAKQVGIDIQVVSFIDTVRVQSPVIQQVIELAALQRRTVVFTSMNAVESVALYLNNQTTDWEIYCIGTTTRQLVGEYFGSAKIAGTANDAASLAEVIVKDHRAEEVLFFCGEQRRDELPQILRSNGIAVNEVTVYETIALPHKIEHAWHGILFFSPSAVVSFFDNNMLPLTTILFAIGSTTASEIKKYTSALVVISDEPGKENLVKKMMAYFSERDAVNIDKAS